MKQCLCISSQWNRLCSTLPGWELKYFLVPLLARKENKSNKFSNNLERFLLLEEFPTDWNLVFNCLCKCVCAHVCVCVRVCARVKHFASCLRFSFWGGHYSYSLHPGHRRVFFSFSLLALFLSGPTAQPSRSLFPRARSCCVFAASRAQLSQTVKEICCSWRASSHSCVPPWEVRVLIMDPGLQLLWKPHRVKH